MQKSDLLPYLGKPVSIKLKAPAEAAAAAGEADRPVDKRRPLVGWLCDFNGKTLTLFNAAPYSPKRGKTNQALSRHADRSTASAPRGKSSTYRPILRYYTITLKRIVELDVLSDTEVPLVGRPGAVAADVGTAQPDNGNRSQTVEQEMEQSTAEESLRLNRNRELEAAAAQWLQMQYRNFLVSNHAAALRVLDEGRAARNRRVVLAATTPAGELDKAGTGFKASEACEAPPMVTVVADDSVSNGNSMTTNPDDLPSVPVAEVSDKPAPELPAPKNGDADSLFLAPLADDGALLMGAGGSSVPTMRETDRCPVSTFLLGEYMKAQEPRGALHSPLLGDPDLKRRERIFRKANSSQGHGASEDETSTQVALESLAEVVGRTVLRTTTRGDARQGLSEAAEWLASVDAPRHISPYSRVTAVASRVRSQTFNVEFVACTLSTLLGALTLFLALLTVIRMRFSSSCLPLVWSGSVLLSALPAGFAVYIAGIYQGGRASRSRSSGRNVLPDYRWKGVPLDLAVSSMVLPMIMFAGSNLGGRGFGIRARFDTMDSFIDAEAGASTDALCKFMAQHRCAGFTQPCKIISPHLLSGKTLTSRGLLNQDTGKSLLMDQAEYDAAVENRTVPVGTLRQCPTNCDPKILDLAAGSRSFPSTLSEPPKLCGQALIEDTNATAKVYLIFGCLYFFLLMWRYVGAHVVYRYGEHRSRPHNAGSMQRPF